VAPGLSEQAGGGERVVLHEFRQVVYSVDVKLFVTVGEEPTVAAGRGGFSAAAATLFSAFSEVPMVLDQLIQRCRSNPQRGRSLESGLQGEGRRSVSV